MKYKVSLMPEDTAGLVHMSLDLMQVEAFLISGSTIGFWANFEAGRCLFTIQSVARRTLMRTVPMLRVAASAVNDSNFPTELLLDGFLRAPHHQHDVTFMASLAMEIKSTAWALAATSDMGECTSFPGRPRS